MLQDLMRSMADPEILAEVIYVTIAHPSSTFHATIQSKLSRLINKYISGSKNDERPSIFKTNEGHDGR
jgi:hypothetical protein